MPKSHSKFRVTGKPKVATLFLSMLLVFNFLLPAISVQTVYAATKDSSVSPELPEPNSYEENDYLLAHEENSHINATYACWYRTDSGFAFVLDVETDEDLFAEYYSENNNTNPSHFVEMFPENFTKGQNTFHIDGWDGKEFQWNFFSQQLTINLDPKFECDEEVTSSEVNDTMLQETDSNVNTSDEGTDAESNALPSLYDIVTTADNTTSLAASIQYLDSQNQCTDLVNLLKDSSATPFTVFVPSDNAFKNLVKEPGNSDKELEQLFANPDELCALISSHVVLSVVMSTDATKTGATLDAYANDIDGIFVKKTNNIVTVDGHKIITADVEASNGIAHIVDSVLLSQSLVKVNDIVTDNSSPKITGEFNNVNSNNYCVDVRVDGITYQAIVKNNQFTVPSGTVSLNPTKKNILFDVVLRSNCGTNNSMLHALTMKNDVLTYKSVAEPEEPANQEPKVLGTTTDPVIVPVSQPYPPATSCGKADCSYVSYVDPSTIDTDGDGVVDSEDPEPNNPDVSEADTDGDGVVDSEDADPNDPNVTEPDTDGDGVVDSEDPEPNNPDVNGQEDTANEDEEDSSNDIFWWFVVGGGLTILAYLYRQRTSGPDA